MIKAVDLTLVDFGEVSLEIDLTSLDPVMHALVTDLEYGRFDELRLLLGRPLTHYQPTNPEYFFQLVRTKVIDGPGHAYEVTLIEGFSAIGLQTRPTPWGYAAYGRIVNGAELAKKIFTERIRTVIVQRSTVHH